MNRNASKQKNNLTIFILIIVASLVTGSCWNLSNEKIIEGQDNADGLEQTRQVYTNDQITSSPKPISTYPDQDSNVSTPTYVFTKTATAASTEPITEFKPVTSLPSNDEILQEIFYASGGAQACFPYGKQRCSVSTMGASSLILGGVFRSHGKEEEAPWWMESYTKCLDPIEHGDIVYFEFRVLGEGESIDFKITGPEGEENYSVTSTKEILVHQSCVWVEEEYFAAKLSWAVSPYMGLGKYTITAISESSETPIELWVNESTEPNFGAHFFVNDEKPEGTENEKLRLVYTGFEPGQQVTTILYIQNRYNLSLEPVYYFQPMMSEKGDADIEVAWPTDLALDQDYWLLVPELIKETPPDSYWGYDPMLWAVPLNIVNAGFKAESLPRIPPTHVVIPRCRCTETVTSSEFIIIRVRWIAATKELAEQGADHIHYNVSINGESISGIDRDRKPAVFAPASYGADDGWGVYWDIPIGLMSPGEYSITAEAVLSENVYDGWDTYNAGSLGFNEVKVSVIK